MGEQNDLNKMINDEESKQISHTLENEQLLHSEELKQDVVSAQAKRMDQVRNFRLELDLKDDEIGATADKPTSPADEKDQSTPVPIHRVAEADISEKAPRAKQNSSKTSGCLKRVIYILVIVLVSVLIAYTAILFLIDSVGLNRTEKVVDIEIPKDSSTEKIANILHDKGMIEYPLFFRAFSKITKSDGKYQQGSFTLSENMGYSDIVDALQQMTPRETVTVTIPEGYTVEDIAKLLEDNVVCAKNDFYDAVINGEFPFDFIKAIPSGNNGRIYRLEGYLFPDTYNFYKDSSGESAVEKLLENFDAKVTPEMRTKMAEMGYTLDDAVILASIIQGEAASKEDMQGVSRVLQNRLAPNSGLPKLQCDSTRDYIKEILPSFGSDNSSGSAYDTYQCDGLPVGAINNPGIDAFFALVNPSTDKDKIDAYFFATDYNTGITYFSKTYSQHQTTCRKYRIGMYG